MRRNIAFPSRRRKARRRPEGRPRGLSVLEAQVRALCQSMTRSQRELTEMGLVSAPERGGSQAETGENPQPTIVRSLFCYQIEADQPGALRITVWSDWPEYRRLVTRYFGLRILIKDRASGAPRKIIEAYRGQSKVESAFRDLKDPRILSTRPQFHWTDQKRHVHAFTCVTANCWSTAAQTRGTKNGFRGSSRRVNRSALLSV